MVLDDEPMGIILRAGQQILRPAKIWAYCWFLVRGKMAITRIAILPVDRRSEPSYSRKLNRSPWLRLLCTA